MPKCSWPVLLKFNFVAAAAAAAAATTAADYYCWQLLLYTAVPPSTGCCLQLLAVESDAITECCYWFCWLLSLATGYCWLLAVAAGC